MKKNNITRQSRPNFSVIAFFVLWRRCLRPSPRQVRLITHSTRKDDKLDARMLARLAHIDPQLLRPIRHRSERAQGHLLAIRGPRWWMREPAW